MSDQATKDFIRVRSAFLSAETAISTLNNTDFNRIITENIEPLKACETPFLINLLLTVCRPIYTGKPNHNQTLKLTQMLLTLYRHNVMWRTMDNIIKNQDSFVINKLIELLGNDNPIVQELRALLLAQELEDN